MKAPTIDLCRLLLSVGITAVLLAGCGGSQPPIGAPGAMPQSYEIAPHNARSGSSQNTSSVPDGFGPSSRLVALNGRLYGTTRAGGAGDEGTVYRITTSGAENVVYSFATGCQRHKKCSDGLSPTGLVHVNRTLYGTTGGGGLGPCFSHRGPDGCGTVFSVATSGAETVLYSFTGGGCRHPRRCRDANSPNALAAIDGTLYGTSWYGGTYGLGTVFSVTTSGVEKVLHSFGRGGKGFGAEGGAYPNEGLIDIEGTLYGTTVYGGTHGAGVVYSMSKTGRTKVLYSFDVGGGSAGPNGSLINVNGVLYGTTSGGGAYHNEGTVYSITTDGTVNVLHSFGAGCPPRKRCSDGEYPDSGLLDVNGVLYGETAEGGSHASGTVFSVTTSGSEKVLRSFSQGYGPGEGLTALNGILYGVTGGGSCDGGTVFSLTLSGEVKRLHTFC